MRLFYTFLFRCFLFSIPILAIVSSFFILDPFGIVLDRKSERLPFRTVDDFVKTEKIIHGESSKYNAFTFGNSRMLGFRHVFPRYLKETDSYYDFSSPGESISDLRERLILLDNKGYKIDHALIGMDNAIIFCGRNEIGNFFSFLRHPTISGKSYAHFLYKAFRLYLSKNFYFKFMDYSIFGKFRPYMSDVYRAIDAETIQATIEKRIARDSLGYFQEKMKVLSIQDEPSSDSDVQLNANELSHLTECAEIFRKHRTRFKIVINPNRQRQKFNGESYKLIQAIFGKQNVFDFSGDHVISNTLHYWYESSHFRTCAGERMLREVYEGLPTPMDTHSIRPSLETLKH